MRGQSLTHLLVVNIFSAAFCCFGSVDRVAFELEVVFVAF